MAGANSTNVELGSLRDRKVVHLTTVDSCLEYLLLPQLRALRDAGCDVIGVSAPGPSAERLAHREGLRHLPLPGSSRAWGLRADLRAAFNLWRILRRERPDVLHTHNPKPGVYGRVVGRLARVPVVVNTVHGLYATADHPVARRAVVYSLEAVASRCGQAELVQNEEDVATMTRLRLAPRRRIHLLGNGVDLDRFEPGQVSDEVRNRLREELGVGDDQILVGTVARPVLEKGMLELIEAAEILRNLPLKVVVAGSPMSDVRGLLDDTVLARAAAAGVTFLGHRDDVREIYAAMDIAVLPSHREGVPRALMEAAAMGKPLVATDVRGCRQVVEAGVNGILVPARDATALAGAIATLANDQELRKRFGEASYLRARERFDEQRVIERVMTTYAQLLRTRAPARHTPSASTGTPSD